MRAERRESDRGLIVKAVMDRDSSPGNDQIGNTSRPYKAEIY